LVRSSLRSSDLDDETKSGVDETSRGSARVATFLRRVVVSTHPERESALRVSATAWPNVGMSGEAGEDSNTWPASVTVRTKESRRSSFLDRELRQLERDHRST
jgi:hypothetical protein